jgi:hypothetical protein
VCMLQQAARHRLRRPVCQASRTKGLAGLWAFGRRAVAVPLCQCGAAGQRACALRDAVGGPYTRCTRLPLDSAAGYGIAAVSWVHSTRFHRLDASKLHLTCRRTALPGWLAPRCAPPACSRPPPRRQPRPPAEHGATATLSVSPRLHAGAALPSAKRGKAGKQGLGLLCISSLR